MKYIEIMRIITIRRIRAFSKQHPDSETALIDWYNTLQNCQANNITELRNTFKTADMVGRATVFNIKGNHYRLIAAIHYNRQLVHILEILTHDQYSKETWKKRHHVFD